MTKRHPFTPAAARVGAAFTRKIFFALIPLSGLSPDSSSPGCNVVSARAADTGDLNSQGCHQRQGHTDERTAPAPVTCRHVLPMPLLLSVVLDLLAANVSLAPGRWHLVHALVRP